LPKPSDICEFGTRGSQNPILERILKILCFCGIDLFQTEKKYISVSSNEAKVYNTKKIDISRVKFSILSIFEEKIHIGCQLEFFWRPFFQKCEQKNQYTKTKISQKAYFYFLLHFILI
jgi:hypothetical protein